MNEIKNEIQIHMYVCTHLISDSTDSHQHFIIEEILRAFHIHQEVNRIES